VLHVAHGPVGPAPDLRDILGGARWQIGGVDDEHGALADDDSGVALRIGIGRVGVPDRIDAVGDLGDASLRRNRRIRDGDAVGQDDRTECDKQALHRGSVRRRCEAREGA
jgi:hypothetical protein